MEQWRRFWKLMTVPRQWGPWMAATAVKKGHDMKKTLAVLTGLCASTGLYQASANLLVSDDFNYLPTPPAASTELNGMSGGAGFGGAWSANKAVTEIVPGGLSFTRADGYIQNGGVGALQIVGNADDAAHRALSTPITADKFYVGMLLKVTGSLAQNNDFAGGWFNTYDGLGLGLKSNQGNGSGNFDVFARTTLNGDNAAYYQNLTIGETYLIVVGFSKDANGKYSKAELWVNPQYSSKLAPDASITQTTTTTSLDSFGFRSANLDTGDAVYYDMLRIGENWADVVVPETSTYVMGALLTLPFGITLYRALRRNRLTS